MTTIETLFKQTELIEMAQKYTPDNSRTELIMMFEVWRKNMQQYSHKQYERLQSIDTEWHPAREQFRAAYLTYLEKEMK